MITTIPQEANSNRRFTVQEAAVMTGLAERTIRKYCQDERIKCTRFGARQFMMTKEAIDEFLSKPREVGNPNFKRKKRINRVRRKDT